MVAVARFYLNLRVMDKSLAPSPLKIFLHAPLKKAIQINAIICSDFYFRTDLVARMKRAKSPVAGRFFCNILEKEAILMTFAYNSSPKQV